MPLVAGYSASPVLSLGCKCPPSRQSLLSRRYIHWDSLLKLPYWGMAPAVNCELPTFLKTWRCAIGMSPLSGNRSFCKATPESSFLSLRRKPTKCLDVWFPRPKTKQSHHVKCNNKYSQAATLIKRGAPKNHRAQIFKPANSI